VAGPRLRLFLTVALVLLSGGPLVIALASLSGIGHRWVDILAQFVAPAMMAAVVLALGALVLRLGAASLCTGLVCIVLLIAGSPQWFPAKGRPSGGQDFTVYFANLHFRNNDIEVITASIREADPDIVVLIEAGDTAGANLDTLLPGLPYRVTTARTTGGSGPARSLIASRWPVKDLAPDIQRLHGVAALVETPDGPVSVAGVHLTRPWPYQFQWGQIIQAQELIDWRRTVDGPVIVAGDFNSVSSARIGRMIRADTDLIAAPGWPGTWHSAMPAWTAITIDHIYRSPDLALMERRLGRPNGSDHRPVISRFVRADTRPAA
jgi:endonuclease/exonuclease/phosphatase (EEP) superfamily protein YafD